MILVLEREGHSTMVGWERTVKRETAERLFRKKRKDKDYCKTVKIRQRCTSERTRYRSGNTQKNALLLLQKVGRIESNFSPLMNRSFIVFVFRN